MSVSVLDRLKTSERALVPALGALEVLNTLIEEAKAEQARNPMTVDELLAENDRLARYGVRQAGKLGIAPKDVSRIIHDHRQSRKAQQPVLKTPPSRQRPGNLLNLLNRDREGVAL